MKTITYNPETHALVPREPSDEMLRKAIKIDLGKDCDEKGICISLYQVMLAAAPQPEPNPNWCAGCSPDNCSCCGAEPVAYTTPQPDRTAELEQLRQRVAELEDERDAALARLSEERDIWDGMLGDAADKIAHLELELDDCLYVLDALWDKQCNKIVTQKWAEILIRNKRDIGALSAEDSSEPTSSE